MGKDAKVAPYKEIKRRNFLEIGFRLFSEKSIEEVTLNDIGKESPYGVATLYRYFNKKTGFVVAVAAWKWEEFREENTKRRPKVDFEGMTALQMFDFYLDSFLELYKNHRDLIRFNHFFGTYIQSENIDAETIRPYQDIIKELERRFHDIYLKAEKDKTLRTDLPEQAIFSTTLHLMFSSVTRYAVGLFYIPEKGFDAIEELQTLKEMLITRYGVET